MTLELPQIWTLSPSDVDLGAIDIQDYLDSGELATGTPTITTADPSVFTLSNKSVSASTLTLGSPPRECLAGQAIQVLVTVASNAAVGQYVLDVTFSTNATPARTKHVLQRIQVV